MTDVIIRADVIITDPENSLHRLDEALSGAVMAEFLAGPVRHFFGDEAAWRFGAEGDRASGDWQELSDATVALRTKMGFTPDDTNIRHPSGSDSMFQYVTEHFNVRYDPWGAEIDIPGTATGEMGQKINTAQFGRVFNPIANFGPTPPRPVIATDERDFQEVVVMLAEHVIRWMTGVGAP